MIVVSVEEGQVYKVVSPVDAVSIFFVENVLNALAIFLSHVYYECQRIRVLFCKVLRYITCVVEYHLLCWQRTEDGASAR